MTLTRPEPVQPVHIFIATPSYGSTLTVGYVKGLLDLMTRNDRPDVRVTAGFNAFESLVTRARNAMVAEFLSEHQFTHLMWIDSDIGFTAADVLRLVDANRPVAAGVYPMKIDGWPAEGLESALPGGTTKADFLARYAQYPANGRFLTETPDADGFLEAIDAPNGFMLIRRDVFLRLIEHFPQMQYRPHHSTPETAPYFYTFYDTMVCPITGHYLSEDYAFCRRIAQIGVRPVIDTRSNLQHQGVAVFEGDFKRSFDAFRSRLAPSS